MSSAPSATLVLGGARSGKSLWGERLACALGDPVYIATAEARDGEMADRIAAHRARRGPQWLTIEAPTAAPEAIREAAGPDRALLVDCLTLWLTNLILSDRDWRPAADDLADAVASAPGRVILIANEVGLGIVPETPLGRAFRDAAGALNQQMAALCGRVAFIAAGLPLTLKGDALDKEIRP